MFDLPPQFLKEKDGEAVCPGALLVSPSLAFLAPPTRKVWSNQPNQPPPSSLFYPKNPLLGGLNSLVTCQKGFCRTLSHAFLIARFLYTLSPHPLVFLWCILFSCHPQYHQSTQCWSCLPKAIILLHFLPPDFISSIDHH